MAGVCPVIAGPTAVGKTGLITALATRYPVEVISLDSRQIYHGLRIGTAQPTAAEQAVCRHHLVDFVSPTEKYDAVRFREDFEQVYLEITERGRQPVLVGGAGMYLTALIEGFMDIPGHSPRKLATVRGELDAFTDATIRQRLETADPESFDRIHANDRYRSQRALEIFLIAGQSMTDLQAAQSPDPVLGLAFPTVILERPVADLDTRIIQRTRAMMTGGWLEETRAVMENHPFDCPGLQSIGYREIVSFLRGALARDMLEETIVLVTRQYAKRQRTWFRGLTAMQRGAPENPDLMAALETILAGI